MRVSFRQARPTVHFYRPVHNPRRTEGRQVEGQTGGSRLPHPTAKPELMRTGRWDPAAPSAEQSCREGTRQSKKTGCKAAE